ncbi:hypothetical protein, partial [Gluconobacter oxydans]|uniref:hypothetical protein n=1 Tax=Gluconobacter oxydans TaxID=442 RepID=UPI0039E72D59
LWKSVKFLLVALCCLAGRHSLFFRKMQVHLSGVPSFMKVSRFIGRMLFWNGMNWWMRGFPGWMSGVGPFPVSDRFCRLG